MNCLANWLLVILVLVSPAYHAHAAAPSEGAPAQPPATSAQSPASQEEPSMQIAETTFDFGEVVEGATVEHTFNVKNTGKAVLQIEQVRPG